MNTHLIQYWRNSLVDESLLNATIKKDQEKICFKFSELKKNFSLPREQVEPIFVKEEEKIREKNKWKRQEKESKKKDADLNIPSLSFLIVPFTLEGTFQHTVNQRGNAKEIHPLWLHIQVDRNGKISLPENPKLPWLDRRFLTPSSSNGYLLGDVEEVDRFFTENPPPHAEDVEKKWYAYLQYGIRMYEHITTGQGKRPPEDCGYIKIENSIAIPYDSAWGMGKPIIEFYDHLLDPNKNGKREEPRLLKLFAASREKVDTIPFLAPESIIENSVFHLSQMDGGRPLAPSQREAIGHLLKKEMNEISVVNGPPGTGKTTMIQSVIASLWSQAALKKERPPLIVVSSSNNQAILNVIDRMGGERKETDLLNERWIEGLSDYGLYLPSKEKAKEIEKDRNNKREWMRIEGRNIDGTVSRLERANKQEFENHFTKKGEEFFGKPFKDIEELVDTLHEELNFLQTQLKEGIGLNLDLLKKRSVLEEKYKKEGGWQKVKKKVERQINETNNRVGELEWIKKQWDLFCSKISLLHRFLSFLPSVKRGLVAQFEVFKDKCKASLILNECTEEKINSEIKTALKEQSYRGNYLTDKLKTLKNDITIVQYIEKKWTDWTRKNSAEDVNPSIIHSCEDEKNILTWLDNNIRYRLFLISVHYWEGRWILEKNEEQNRDYSKEGRRKFWERYAMLFPCLITTMHSGLTFFTQLNKDLGEFIPLANFLDMLIIDEAGQVNPALAGGMISLARKALFVGDIHQIEPIISIPETVDRGNAIRYNICRDYEEYEETKKEGILMSQNRSGVYGNALKVAQNCYPYTKQKKDGTFYRERGLFLSEHWRCHDKIIGYCNELVYENRLIPKAMTKADHPWPRLGYGHVKGHLLRKTSSPSNPVEAETLVQWLKEHEAELEKYYPGQSLDDIVAIITPFAAQKWLILESLKDHGLVIKQVGTVHSMQGAEKPMILFSPVYTAENRGDFIDQRPYMLNVAVSRAIDSFLVIGDMEIFDPEENTPSGLMARHLYKEQENELIDLKPGKREELHETAQIEQINTLQGHREALLKGLELAKERVEIVSPFIRIRAIDHDDIDKAVQKANGQAEVNIYIDRYMNNNSPKSAKHAIEKLKNSGANVYMVNNVHSKALWIDNHTYIEGSFNWLSAVRNSDSEYANLETSLIYRGEKVGDFIDKTRKLILEKIDKKDN